LPLTLRPATPSEYQAILRLIDNAASWLPGKGTDQWAKPWPDQRRRDARVMDDLLSGRTWLAVDGTVVAATITIDPADSGVWPAGKRREPAIYVRRIIVRRRCAGLDIGARLLDWASDIALRVHGARWIRVDVWTTNDGLHEYYRAQGFEDAGLRDLADEPGYPSRALFQRSTALWRPDYRPVLRPFPPPGPWPRPYANGQTLPTAGESFRREQRPESQ
jgi:GNAT superfamily N-acetyltransferase